MKYKSTEGKRTVGLRVKTSYIITSKYPVILEIIDEAENKDQILDAF